MKELDSYCASCCIVVLAIVGLDIVKVDATGKNTKVENSTEDIVD